MKNRNSPPPPPLDLDGHGKARTGALRVRPGWFGLAIVEEQIEDVHNRVRYWQRLKRPMVLVEGYFSDRDLT